jgi:hypothetical protein
MNISELIKDLEEALKDHGDLDVHVWADHGQQCMKAYSVGPQWVDDEGDTVCDEDLNNPDEEMCKDDYTFVLEIAG